MKTNNHQEELESFVPGLSIIALTASFLGIFAFMEDCNKPKEIPLAFKDTKRGYEYNIGGGFASYTFLVDTNRDGVADLRIHAGYAGRARFYQEKTPSPEDREIFNSAYKDYMSNRENLK